MVKEALGKVAFYGGCTFMIFVYGAGAYSLGKAIADRKMLKRRMADLEDECAELANAVGWDMQELRKRVDRLEDCQKCMCSRIDDISSDFEDLRADLELDECFVESVSTAKSEEKLESDDADEEVHVVKKSSKTAKK